MFRLIITFALILIKFEVEFYTTQEKEKKRATSTKLIFLT
jgi:hypothetical protein